MKKFLIIENAGDSHKSIFEANFNEDMKTIDLIASEDDGNWTNPGEIFATLFQENDGIRVVMPGEETVDQWFDWSQIEYMNILYELYNQNMKSFDPATVSIYRLEE